MVTVLEIAVIAAVVVIGLTYMGVVACFIYYHNQMFNYLLYNDEKWAEKMHDPFTMEELPDEIDLDEVWNELNREGKTND